MAGSCSPNLQPSPLSISVGMICQGGNTEGKFNCVRHGGYEQDAKMLGGWEKAGRVGKGCPAQLGCRIMAGMVRFGF